MNKVIIMGRMANDPELRTTQNGISVTSFTVAVDRPKLSKDEERKTDWIDVVAWRSTAEFVCKYFHKGDPIVVNGTLQSRNWEDKECNKRKNIEVQADGVEFVPRTKETEKSEKPKENDEFMAVDDEDLPFDI